MPIIDEQGHTPAQRDIIARSLPLRDREARESMSAYRRHRAIVIDALWLIAIAVVVLTFW